MVWQGGRAYELREISRRVSVLLVFCLIFFGVLLLRLFYLQIIRGKYFADISERNRTQIFIQRAARGVIYDKHNNILVDHRPTFSVLFSPLQLSEDVFSSVIGSLEKILKVSKSELMKLVGGRKKSSVVIRLADEVSRHVMFGILEARPNLPGVTITIEPTRRYPYQDWASHCVGHLGEIGSRELLRRINDGYKQGDIIGKSGIEKVYDYYLRGKSGGMQLEVDATGTSQRILYDIPSIPGNNVILNIDKYIQMAGEEMFRKNGYSGAAVALDPLSGKVYALISSPNYDPTVFLKPLNTDQREKFFVSEQRLMFNRALQGQYALGSVFKIITLCAALESGSELINRQVTCKGMFKLGRREFKCWKKHGKVDLLAAVTHSCDVYFYRLGLSAGVESIAKHGRMFGLGEINGIDLPGEKTGLMPDAQWKKKKYNEIWYKGDTVNLSIGQGFLLVTPLQAANLIAAIASQGKLYNTYVLDKVISPDGEVLLKGKHRLVRQIHLNSETWNVIHNALVNVVTDGTGRACRIRGITIAGKTGTVQNPHGKDHAWFVAYASLPGERPRIAVAVLVEHGEHGSSVAAPIAREMIRAAFPEINNAG